MAKSKVNPVVHNTPTEVVKVPTEVVQKAKQAVENFSKLEEIKSSRNKESLLLTLDLIATPDLRRINTLKELVNNDSPTETILEALVGFNTISQKAVEDFKLGL